MKNGLAEVAQSYLDLISRGEIGVWIAPWDLTRSRTPITSIGGYSYRGNFANSYLGMKTLLDYENCQIWGNFHQMKRNGIYPKKGSGVDIPRPIFKSVVNEEGQKESRLVGFSTSTVFNLLPCVRGKEGSPGYDPEGGRKLWKEKFSPQVEKKEEIGEVLFRFETFFREVGTKFQGGGDSCCYIPSKDIVNMPFPAFFNPGEGTSAMEEYYRALAHECSHVAQHKADLRENGQKNNLSYACNEVSAEVSALLVAYSLGLKVDMNNTVHYSTGYAKNFSADPTKLPRAIDNGVKCAIFILEKMGLKVPELVTKKEQEEED